VLSFDRTLSVLLPRPLRHQSPDDLSPYEIIGVPADVQGAEALKEISPHEFEWWAIVARPSWPWGRFTGGTPIDPDKGNRDGSGQAARATRVARGICNHKPRRVALFPVPCSLFPVPCSLFPVPCSLFPVPCSLSPVP